MMHPTPDQIAYMKAHIDEDRRSWLVGANVTCLIVAYLSVALRLISRCKIGIKIGLDDWLICGAAGCVTGHVACLLATMQYGFGRHIILMKNTRQFVLIILTAQTFYNLAIPFIKLSILSLYGRIFRRTNGWFMPTLWISALFVFLFTIPQCFVYIFQCVPIESLWSQMPNGSKAVCINFKAAIIAFGVIHILTDWFILAIPIPVVLNLQLDKRTKWSICSVFFVGGAVCIVSVIRLVYAKNVETVDPTWDYVPIASISTLESTSGILVACLPTWRPLFRFLGRGITSYFSGSKNEDPSLRYGNKIDIGRGRWASRSRNRSRSRSRRGLRVLMEKPHNIPGVPGNRVSFKPGTKRSGTSMSGDSVERILEQRGPSKDIELENTKPSPSTTCTPLDNTSSISPGKTSNRSPSPRGTLDFATTPANCKYEAKAGADRWESLMQQQRIKNESQGRESRGAKNRTVSPGPGRSYGDVAFGGRAVAAQGKKEREEVVRRVSEDQDSSWGVGLGGIVMTKTVTSVTDTQDRKSGDGK